MPSRFDLSEATAATVVTVSVVVPPPPLTVSELKVHLGGTDVAGVTAQLRFTVELKFPEGVTVTSEVAALPAVMVAGDSAVAASAKDGAVVTVRFAVVDWTKPPDIAVIVNAKLLSPVEELVVTVSGVLTCALPTGTVAEAWEQEAAEGSPEQVTVTVPTNPGCGFTYTR